MGYADSGIEQTQIVIDLCDSSHGGTRVFGCGFLVNGNRRGQALNAVHIRFFHLSQKLTCIGRQALHIAALTVCKDSIKCQRRFSGAGKPGHNDQLISWNIHINII